MNGITYKVMFKGPEDARATVWSSGHSTEQDAARSVLRFLHLEACTGYTIDSKGKYHITFRSRIGNEWEDIVYIVKYDGRRKAI